MPDLDLRPLSLGEILDRTFTLYRRNFVLFIGIAAIPHLLILALNLAQVLFTPLRGMVPTRPPAAEQLQVNSGLIAFGIIGVIFGIIIGVIVYLVAYLLSQGATVFAVSELYLGRTTTIGASFRRMRGELANLFGVTFLSGLAVGGAFILLIIPGFYVACRLITCVPAALLEDLGPSTALGRSFRLTEGSAGRSFVIYLLYFVLLYSAMMLFAMPFLFAIALSAKDPSLMRFWLILSQIGNFLAGILISPIFTIATAVFYYDLRVRKEAFDLQVMMHPSGVIPSRTPGVPSMFS